MDTDSLNRAVKNVSHAITAQAAPGHDAAGGSVSCLTEAVMGVTAGLCKIADAINRLADVFENRSTDDAT